MPNELGDLRRSAVVSTFGPGAVVDFRAGDAAVSGVAAGLEEWDTNFPPAGLLHPQTVNERRLEKKLGVKGFRLPPVRDPAKEADAARALVAVRFPDWLQCPSCDRIAPSNMWDEQPGRAGRYCAPCGAKTPGGRAPAVVPVRFVMACEAGHLDEFPWHFWVGHSENCKNRRGALRLKSEEAGLSGLILSCPDCGQRKSMEHVFSGKTWERFADCRGKRPWIAGGDESCSHKPRAVQRGASNLYFPVIESALAIPPWSDRLQEALGVHWDPILDTNPEDRAAFVRILARGTLAPVLAELGLSADELAREVALRVEQDQAIDEHDLRGEEYRQFVGGTQAVSPDREFEIRPRPVPAALDKWFARLVKVVRLREVRAMTGFTRVHPPGEVDAHASLSSRKLDWFPAIEVRGEGVFLELNEKTLAEWESQDAVRLRANRVNARRVEDARSRFGADAPLPPPVTPRFLLVHTLAHALMGQLTLDCGYSSTSLRERLYVRDGDGPMAGLLIFTASTDADGTLGGLQRQGEPDRMARTVHAALEAQAWCSSDPLCIEDMLAPEDGLSLAACHACVLAPETACEEFNRFLDRAMLVGTPSDPTIGFFHGLRDAVA